MYTNLMKLFALLFFVVIANVIAECPYGGEDLKKIGNGFEEGTNEEYWGIAQNKEQLRTRVEKNYNALKEDNSSSGDVWIYCHKCDWWHKLTPDILSTELIQSSSITKNFLICHGNLHSVHSRWVAEMARAIYNRERETGVNIMAVDWGDDATATLDEMVADGHLIQLPLGGGFYNDDSWIRVATLRENPETAYATAMQIPRVARTAFNHIKNELLLTRNLTIIGHSHGAHVGGLIAQMLLEDCQRPKRLIGLETSNYASHSWVYNDKKYPIAWNGNSADVVEFYKTSWVMSMGTGRSDEVYGTYNFYLVNDNYIIPKAEGGLAVYESTPEGDSFIERESGIFHNLQSNADTPEGRFGAERHDFVEQWFIETIRHYDESSIGYKVGYNWNAESANEYFGEYKAILENNKFCGVISVKHKGLLFANNFINMLSQKISVDNNVKSKIQKKYFNLINKASNRHEPNDEEPNIPCDNMQDFNSIIACITEYAIDNNADSVYAPKSAIVDSDINVYVTLQNLADNDCIPYDALIKNEIDNTDKFTKKIATPWKGGKMLPGELDEFSPIEWEPDIIDTNLWLVDLKDKNSNNYISKDDLKSNGKYDFDKIKKLNVLRLYDWALDPINQDQNQLVDHSSKIFVQPGKVSALDAKIRIPKKAFGRELGKSLKDGKNGEEFLLLFTTGTKIPDSDSLLPNWYFGDLYTDNNYVVKEITIKNKMIDCAIAFDISGSTNKDKLLSAFKQNALSITNTLYDSGFDVRMGLMAFNDYYNLFAALTNSKANMINGINLLPDKGTGDEFIYQALKKCITGYLGKWRQDAIRTIILITDEAPKDPCPRTGLTASSLIELARHATVKIQTRADSESEDEYPVVIYTIAPEDCLSAYETITKETGGKSYSYNIENDIVDDIIDILNDIIEYPSTSAPEPYFDKQTLSLKMGWNLCGVTLSPDKKSISLLKNEPACWVWTNGRFHMMEELHAGQGVWIYASDDKTLELTGEAEKSLPLDRGWNLVMPSLYPEVTQKTCFGLEGRSYIRVVEPAKYNGAAWVYY